LEGVTTKSWVTATIFAYVSHKTLCVVPARTRFTESWDRLVDRNTTLDSVD